LEKVFFLVCLILFFVHPYAFLFPHRFLASQFTLGGSFNINVLVDLDFFSAINLWIKAFTSTLYFSVPFALSIINPFLINLSTKNFHDQILNLLTIICTLIVILSYSIFNRANIEIYYLKVIIPISFVQIIIFFKYFLQINLFKKNYFKYIILLSILIYLFPEILEIHKRSHERLSYKQSVNYKTFLWAQKNLNQFDRIVIDHRFAVPSKLNNITCHYWRECTTYDKIVSFNPNYVAFTDPLPVWGWNQNEQGQNLKKYVEENNMKILNVIESQISDYKIVIYHKN
jgi:hypothetical protein